ncbi:MAG: DNA polymerase III subunit alpha [Actinobacteria bacterium]|nr:DNA polymerase III subunit alpha [Actinomycetota bacterium]
MKTDFVHLHTHTDYSMLDGASRLEELIDAALKDGQPALAITDHGNLYGVIDFYKMAAEKGIKPIIGLEAYMAKNSRFERPARKGRIDDTGGEGSRGEKLYYHLILLCETNEGYQNLIKLSSYSWLEGYFYKPRVDFELLQTYHEGLIASTGCLGGVVPQALLKGDDDEAYQLAGKLQDIFGKENFFVELQDHGLAGQKKVNPMLISLAAKIGAPLVATNDSHYIKRDDAVIHDVLLCIQTGSTLNDPGRFHFEGSEHYLKSAQEMRRVFSDFPIACDNTLDIAGRCNVDIPFSTGCLPKFPLPQGFDDAKDYLSHLTFQGAYLRYGSGSTHQGNGAAHQGLDASRQSLPSHVKERLDYELAVINSMGFADYFLIVWDLVTFAKNHSIRVGPGRGSVGGSCVAYCLGIVQLDPLAYGLLFERFLNKGRKQLPDIDMDFDERKRLDMIQYVNQRYGRDGMDHVAQIVTFSTIKARAAVRDAARVLGYPYLLGDKIAKAMPPLLRGRDTPLHACFDYNEQFQEGYTAASELRELYESDPDAKRVIDVAKGLEGLRRQEGIHAAAVVITDKPLISYLPVQRKATDEANDLKNTPTVTQYEMHAVEALGLLKMDFLGLRNLSVIEMTLEEIEKNTGYRLDIDNIPLDDPLCYELLKRGDSIGVFQLEGGPMRSLLRSLSPETLDDIAVCIALYRPGPMADNMHKEYAYRKNKTAPVTYLHPEMEAILGDTQGLMIYQEQMMQIAQHFAGYSLEEADDLRKACSKKIRSLLELQRNKFVNGAKEKGYTADLANKLFDIIEPFADYAFNKSHSYGYGLVAYQTAYLKAHWPVFYMAALLSSVNGDKDRTALYLSECRTMGIRVLPPDINRSLASFTPVVAGDTSNLSLNTPVGGEIVFGLAAVRNVGESIVSHIVDVRESKGLFKDFYDFCTRVDAIVLNKRTVESLIKSGAFDSMAYKRKGLTMVFEQIVDRSLAKKKYRDMGMVTLFEACGAADDSSGSGEFNDYEQIAIPETEFDKTELLALEKEMLGMYVSDHPLMGIEDQLRASTGNTISEVIESLDESLNNAAVESSPAEVQLGGVVTTLVRRYTKKGDLMATFVLEDLSAAIEVVIFPKTYMNVSEHLVEDTVVCVTGKLSKEQDTWRLLASDLKLFDQNDFPVSKQFCVIAENCEGSTLEALKELLWRHPGNIPVVLVTPSRDGELSAWHLGKEFSVDLTFELEDMINAIGFKVSK